MKHRIFPKKITHRCTGLAPLDQARNEFCKFPLLLPICTSIKLSCNEDIPPASAGLAVPNLGVILVNLFLPRVSLLNYKYGS